MRSRRPPKPLDPGERDAWEDALARVREKGGRITIQDLSGVLSRSIRTIRLLHQKGEGPPRVKHGHRMKYLINDVREWLSGPGKRFDTPEAQSRLDAAYNAIRERENMYNRLFAEAHE
jgi:hypothetical protein